MTTADRLERQCRIVEACQGLDAAAQALAGLADAGETADLWRLSLVVDTSAASARALAESYEAWAELAAGADALLARELRRLGESLRAVADDAARSRALAVDFAESESEEALVS